MLKTITLISAVIFCFSLFTCSNNHAPVSQTRLLLGTFVTITDYDSTLEESMIHSAFDSAFQAISKIEALTNPYDSLSTIGKINRLSDRQPNFSINPQLHSILSSALEISEKTNGAFNITLWPVFKLWNFGTDSNHVPEAKSINSALKRVNFRGVELRPDSLKVAATGMGIDVGGIIKGYAVEVAREILIKKGLKDFIIDAGGNLGIEWHKRVAVTVKVRHPRKDGEFWCNFSIDSSAGIATSGDYQYYFLENGKRYHHIIDPKTGYPAQPMVGTTIIASDAIRADGFSTAIFVMGPVRGGEFIESNPKLEGIMIFPIEGRLETFVSSGLKKSYNPLANEK